MFNTAAYLSNGMRVLARRTIWPVVVVTASLAASSVNGVAQVSADATGGSISAASQSRTIDFPASIYPGASSALPALHLPLPNAQSPDSQPAVQALPSAGAKRPATVPADYVITPFGYFHPSCVSRLAKGDLVQRDQNTIQHANGISENIHTCAYAHYHPDGRKVTGQERAAQQPTINHAWIEYASTTTSSSFGYMYAYWTVPPAPTTNDGQTVYLFPGMEDLNDVVTIIQPVLGWNSDYASTWGIASWNCCASGTVFEGTPVSVNSGDTILGYMFDTCASGTLSCPSWDIVTYDVTSGRYSELLNSSSQGQTFNWAFAGALEVYNVKQCGDFPSNGAISFHDIGLYNDSFSLINDPVWSVSTSSGLSPTCNFGGSVPQQVTLFY